jgi:hypothetical protein
LAFLDTSCEVSSYNESIPGIICCYNYTQVLSLLGSVEEMHTWIFAAGTNDFRITETSANQRLFPVESRMLEVDYLAPFIAS